jgi:hypothetical protein
VCSSHVKVRSALPIFTQCLYFVIFVDTHILHFFHILDFKYIKANNLLANTIITSLTKLHSIFPLIKRWLALGDSVELLRLVDGHCKDILRSLRKLQFRHIISKLHSKPCYYLYLEWPPCL